MKIILIGLLISILAVQGNKKVSSSD